MSTEIDSDIPTVANEASIKKDVAEYVKRVKAGLALSEHSGMSVVVQDHSEQLKALFSQSGFIIAQMFSEIPDVKWIEQSLSTAASKANPSMYSVNGVCITLRIRCPESAKARVESWITENEINLCGNVSVTREEHGIRILLATLS